MSNHFIRNLFFRAARLCGFRQLSWNLQYESGLWDCPERSPNTLSRVLDMCNGGKLAEFGCGKGEILRHIPSHAYSEYIGFDISDKAIAVAQVTATRSGFRNAAFYQMDMARWPGDSGIQLILVEECLYYLNRVEQESFLEKCCQSLTPTGKLLVIVHDGVKHAPTIKVCRRVCRLIKEEIIQSRTYLTLAPQSDHSPKRR